MREIQSTFAFIDLAGFTALAEAHGDQSAVRVVDELIAATTSCLDGRGRLVKSIGDAVMLSVERIEDSLGIVKCVLERMGETSDLPLPRAGLHFGGAAETNGDYIGTSVNLAARVAAQAFGGQVLGTEGIAQVARNEGFSVVDLGSFELKNLSRGVELFEIHLVPGIPGGSIDPVCRMHVQRDSAAGRLRYEDSDYWFCSLECASSFLAAPDRFA